MNKHKYRCLPGTAHPVTAAKASVQLWATAVLLILFCLSPVSGAAPPPGVPAAGVTADLQALTERVATLEAALAAQQARIEALESQNQAQASQIAALEAASAAQSDRISALEQDNANLASVLQLNDDGDLVISGANLYIQSGTGATDGAVNGKGNLIVGYNEGAALRDQSGSHNVVIGPFHRFSGYGGIVAGANNGIGRFGSVTAGQSNFALADFASVSGGEGNSASGFFASVSGGEGGIASGSHASVGGGLTNTASGDHAAVSGGFDNIAGGPHSAVSGGRQCEQDATFVNGWAAGGINPGCPVNNFNSF